MRIFKHKETGKLFIEKTEGKFYESGRDNHICTYFPEWMVKDTRAFNEISPSKFAVTGSLIHLIKFEKFLRELDYKNARHNDERINQYAVRRSADTRFYLTVGLHVACWEEPTTYISASNDGGAESENCLFHLPHQFDAVLALADAHINSLKVLLETEDGGKKRIDDKCWTVTPDFRAYFIKNGLDEKAPWKGYKYFANEFTAKKYANDNRPRFSKVQVKAAMDASFEPIKNIRLVFGQEPLQGIYDRMIDYLSKVK